MTRRLSPIRAILTALLAGVGFAVWCGSNRVPADATQTLVLVGHPEQAIHSGGTLRVAMFNIHSGKGLDGKRDLERIAGCLDDFDIVGLNEVRGNLLGFSENQAATLGRTLGMASVFAPTERKWWHNHFGNGLLTRVPLSATQSIPLAGTQRSKYRNAMLVNFEFAGRIVRLLIVHVDRVEDRERQLEAVCDLFLSLDEPAILMGDLNTSISDPRLRELLETPGVRDAVGEALPGPPPAERIDWILTRGLRGISAECRRTDASDHPLVCTELELEPAE